MGFTQQNIPLGIDAWENSDGLKQALKARPEDDKIVVTAGFAPWNRKIAAAIQEVGTPDFPQRIEEALKAVIDLEIEITSLILRGHSSAAIADALNIAEGAVKIHRKNIHQKLRISSQAELFSLFLFHLSKQ